MILRSGIDMVEINRFSDLKPDLRERFLHRVFTNQEMEDCGGHDQKFAGRFAVKEAVAKALGTGIGPVSWKDIEIITQENGEPLLVLHNKAHEIAESLGLVQWSISISHTSEHAIGLAVAIGEKSPPMA
ncbi:MAG: holo-ACP synthase [Anaerolineaceae bacterium]|nr:holo-ACP synthase [Anaerolineaceae bacterium]